MLGAEPRKPDPPDAPPAPPPVEFVEEAADYYLERFKETAGYFDTAAPKCVGELGGIPLPVAMPRRKMARPGMLFRHCLTG
jgi:hypothetical protein